MLRLVMIWSFCTVLLTGCGIIGGRDAVRPRSEAPVETGRSLEPDYRLSPRDQVVFEMFNEPDVKTTQRLSSSGEMTLPLIGTVQLAGRTLREAENIVRERYARGGYFVDPQVMLSVAEYGERFVTVLGQVSKPARIPLPIEAPSLSVVEAVTQAGGFTRIAKADAVQITRHDANGREARFVIDVQRLLDANGGAAREGFQLLPGDVVFVPERLF